MLLAIADQGLWSSGTFLLGVFVGRFLGAEGLGIFSLGMALITGVGTAYNSLVVAPAAHFGPTVYQNRVREYSGRLVRATLIPGVLITLAAILIGSTFAVGGTAQGIIASIAVAPLVLVAWLSRRIKYIDGRPGAALTGTAIYTVTAVGGVGWLGAVGSLSLVTAFGVLGLASLFQLGASSLLSSKKPGVGASEPPLIDIGRNHWRYGRWLLAAGLATWIGNEGYTVVLASIVIDLVAVGGLRAATNLTRATGIFFEALSLLFVPRLSAQWLEGRKQPFLDSLSNIRRAFFVVPALATIASILWGELILVSLYGPTFSGIEPILVILMAGMALNGLAEADGIGLGSIGNTRAVFLAHSARAIAAPAIGLTTGLVFGIYGLLGGYLAGQAIKAIVMGWGFRRAIRHSPTGGNTVTPASIEFPPGPSWE